MMKVEIYSDGSCLGNPGMGGYASLIMYNEYSFWVVGYQKDTTNNQMEIVALIKALEFVEKENWRNITINVFTDSKYLQLGISEWIYTWIKAGWKIKKKKILNIELWTKLFILKNKYPFNIYWIKSHSKNTFNNLVDKKARFMANQIKNMTSSEETGFEPARE